MPKTNCDYSRTVIYKIVCNDLSITDCYVGHTTEFTKRKSSHKSHCNNENDRYYNFNIYKFIRDNGGWDNWSMIEIEKCPCIDGNEARARERHWYEQLNATLNIQTPNRSDAESQQEYRQQNKEKINEYRLNNKEKLTKYNSEYRLNNKDKANTKCVCECGGVYTHANKSQHHKTKKHLNYINSLEV